MNKTEYFKGIAKKVAEKRTKGNYSKEELAAFREGRSQAYKEVLKYLHPNSSDIYYKQVFQCEELWKFCRLQLDDLRSRLKKARKIYLTQQKIIQDLSQLTID